MIYLMMNHTQVMLQYYIDDDVDCMNNEFLLPAKTLILFHILQTTYEKTTIYTYLQEKYFSSALLQIPIKVY